MIDLSEGKAEILLFAPDLLGQSLAMQLTMANKNFKIITRPEELTQNPSLIIWALELLEFPGAIEIELRRLEQTWQESPVLLLLPSKVNLSSQEILQFGCAGILQDPDFSILNESVSTLINGGRAVRLIDKASREAISLQQPIGLGQWLLISGIQQINKDIESIDILINNNATENIIIELIIQGRRRELIAAKGLLIKLWGPLQTSFLTYNNYKVEKSFDKYSATQNLENNITTLKLDKRDQKTIWELIRDRVKEKINSFDMDVTETLMAINSLNSLRSKSLMNSLLTQLDIVISRLQSERTDNYLLSTTWLSVQEEIRKESLRLMTGNYARLPLENELTPIAEKLIALADLTSEDDELPLATDMLAPLILNDSVKFQGQLLPPDDPRALIHLEDLFSNWIIRTSEILSSEVISVCAQWPELRTYFLKSKLISTRELERLRNQINSLNRWANLVQRPIRIYESKRLLYKFNNQNIQQLIITEPRDNELRQLGWWQQQVTLLVETRDALAPQVQLLIKKLGDLMVILLTQVLGRSIGLVGRGIAQGMGRTFRRG